MATGPVNPILNVAEAASALAGAALLTWLAFRAHLQPGGFYNDDWAYLVASRFNGGFSGGVRALDFLSFRPLMTLYWPAIFGVLGTNPTYHVAWTLGVGGLMATLFFLLLRSLGMARLHAGVISSLVLVFPGSDSTRYWPSMSSTVASVALYLGGLLATLAAFRRSGRRAAALHATGLALYLSSVLLYEVAYSLLLATGIVYVALFGRRSVRRWAIDVGCVGAVLAFVTSGTFYERLPVAKMPARFVTIGRQAGWLLADSFWVPAHPDARTVVAICLALGAVIAGAAWRVLRAPDGDPRIGRVRVWLMTAVGALAAGIVSYLAIVPSATLSPLGEGQQNRANVLGGIWAVLFVYAFLLLAYELLIAANASKQIALVLVVGAVSIVGTGFIVQVRADQRLWEKAALIQQYAVTQISKAQPHLPQNSTVISFGIPSETAPGVPIFSASWDLAGALAVRYGDASIRAIPVVERSRVDCDLHRIAVRNRNDSFGPQTGKYRETYFIDANAPASTRIASPADCRRVRATLIAAGLILA